MKTIEVKCYHCGSEKYNFYDTENGFNLVKCLDCGLLYVNPCPIQEEIDLGAKTGLHQGQEDFDMTGNFSPNKVEKYLHILGDFGYEELKNLQNYQWLDIGCGHGEFIKAVSIFSNNQIKTKGLEPNVNKQKSAQQQGLENHTEKYDFISTLNVFSHLPNPVEDLRKWCNLLKEGGEILLETGDSANLDSKDHHKPYYLPDHLSFVSEEIAVSILKKIGLEIIEIKKYRFPGFPEFNVQNLIKQTAKFVLPNKSSSFNFFPKYPNRDMWIRAKRKN
ncbi:class I SAM-dependent methyltransferase [Dapis sp. BLCC M172]|uniref:class I SAM-dependent methyltransferase n=2 Tax=Microcoleaceae TaxID=1892252 RepID=UPI003CF24244